MSVNDSTREEWWLKAEVREAANRKSAGVRQAKAALRKALAAGEITLSQIASDKPECLLKLRLWELVEMVPWMGPKRLVRLNARAMAMGVNLALPFEWASPADLGWLIDELER